MDQKKAVSFLTFWVVNTVVLLVANSIFGGNVVVGNQSISTGLSAIFAGLVLTALIPLAPKAVEQTGYKIKNQNVWPAIFLASNIVVLWILKRLAMVTGFGISSILWVLILAIVITFVELAVAKTTGAMEEDKKQSKSKS
ncbi:MAG: hypothetical protein UT92_C0013G0002 [Candidatus Curtissbacteria bacterium GW2011_GWA1_40_24]|uniref:Uncharacterized protein n=2 Tax=Microgenomates group TaxID=1794810 RepID=A0A0G0WP14_9BACT|nr:MAG: hypothetical protein UT92_C0013G0002 [Candidatus Curtissbacteria bacterium GW2011_GWA1_40_24]KKS13807.1 MAG: hypothetical protein UU67_C0016G0020 [Candidatus Daviesbacteria bacterium GW2011_GWB1_41_5]